MKKILIITLATSVTTLSVLAQGSLGSVNNINTGITTPGANASNPNSATTYYTGNISLEVFYAAAASVTQSQINIINALDGSTGGGAAALALLNTDGFVLASASTLTGTTTGAVTGNISSGGFNFPSSPASASEIGLPGAPTGATAAQAWLAFYVVGSGGSFNNYSGVLAFANGTGGNPNQTPTPGFTAPITGLDALGLNLVLTTTPVPEPSTMALAGLGGLAALMFRRKK